MEVDASGLVLKLDKISKRYKRGSDEVTALNNVSFEMQRGESVVIRGPSGSGKSTLLVVAAGMLRPTSGKVWLCGQDISSSLIQRATYLRRSAVGIMLPNLELVPYLSAIENVYLADSTASGKRRAADVLSQVGLGERLKHLPSELSTGEQRRVLVARSLLNDPKILLCDEPTANLDVENATRIRSALKQACDRGVALLIVSHEDASLFSADRILEMNAGQLHETTSLHSTV